MRIIYKFKTLQTLNFKTLNLERIDTNNKRIFQTALIDTILPSSCFGQCVFKFAPLFEFDLHPHELKNT